MTKPLLCGATTWAADKLSQNIFFVSPTKLFDEEERTKKGSNNSNTFCLIPFRSYIFRSLLFFRGRIMMSTMCNTKNIKLHMLCSFMLSKLLIKDHSGYLEQISIFFGIFELMYWHLQSISYPNPHYKAWCYDPRIETMRVNNWAPALAKCFSKWIFILSQRDKDEDSLERLETTAASRSQSKNRRNRRLKNQKFLCCHETQFLFG